MPPKMDDETTVTPETLEGETVEETVETPKNEELTKAQEFGTNQKIRAEKAEREAKELKERLKAQESAKQEGLTNKDILYLAKSDIHEEDLDEVITEAKLRGWDVPTAHKFLKPILNVKAEERKTAAATQTTGGARGASKVTGEDILTRAEKTGQLPDSDEEIQALFLARQARRRSK